MTPAAAIAVTTQSAGNLENLARGDTGPSRKRNAPRSYDEVKRRKGRARTGGPAIRYVARGKRSRTGLSNTIEVLKVLKVLKVGPLTVERTVEGRYEWRGAELRAMTGKRQRLWLGARIWDPGD